VALVEDLAEIVGPEQVLRDPDLIATYSTDWTRRYQGSPRLVVRPGSTGEVSEILRICQRDGAALVPQGGNTGLVGGGVPRGDSMIVLSTQRLTHCGEVDPGASQVSLGAGVTVAGWRRIARAVGLDAPVDFAARDSATVGGATATNAGGSRVVRFGAMRSQVVGLHAVLADGSVVGSLAGLTKETIGLHWPSVLCGSEGTLAVITEVRLKVVPWFQHVTTALIATRSLANAVATLGAVRPLPTLDAVELILPEAMALVADHLGATPPVGDAQTQAYLMVEVADHTDPTGALLEALENGGEIQDAAVATDGPQRQRLIAFRDRITESISAQGVPLKLDVAAPVDALDELLTRVRRCIERYGGRLVPFGHLAEGNVHVNVLEPGNVDAITAEVLHAAASLRGTISAEHGVGVAKSSWLHLVRSPQELAAIDAVKYALDPTDILNPGVLRTR
jgi:FAD/FMN-containing dehydrogenase